MNLDEIKRLCDSEKIEFHYYDDVQFRKCIFKFKKNSKKLKHSISYLDLNNKPHMLLIKEIIDKLFELIDNTRNDIK